ncbi:BLUF domain-containing protein [Actinomycetospora cinnamomea]|uniref:FAD-dependent sensor of blue light n=1 Tax=Actinomycetospora cinnamomea TaxID=663609 RepID=A0A2U1EYJ5_9PSEU|nr:BLUF domain-containing protein [Actinomycetospora cinnamomea]PVZ04981.1 FAD-dependent sensor of blue light [Actinomycetospora cinnamomea]
MSDAGTTFRLIYSSHSRIPTADRETALARIFDVSRANNKKAGVTGALLITDHYFVQALEGDEAIVTGLYERIKDDSRHDQVSLLESGTVESRAFPRWSMAQVSKSGHADIPLHDVGGRIHPAARATLRVDEIEVLTRMRNVIGADTV